jgi:hypothetical protein
VYEHVLSKVTYDNRRLISRQSTIDAGVTAPTVGVRLHQLAGDIAPVTTLRYKCVTLDDPVSILGNEMAGTFEKVTAKRSSV